MIIASILGLYLGSVFIVRGNLLTVMVIHALYDFAALRLFAAHPACPRERNGELVDDFAASCRLCS